MMTNQFSDTELEQMSGNQLFDIRRELEQYIKELYHLDITDTDYWRSYHQLNGELKRVEQELRQRNLI